ncbi:hypothetical protein Q1695_003663 [Nippostrongylus brasiliensis]|nr:hypothetical protein Q1695_003663 [Nippostrongylus brasiliensis]
MPFVRLLKAVTMQQQQSFVRMFSKSTVLVLLLVVTLTLACHGGKRKHDHHKGHKCKHGSSHEDDCIEEYSYYYDDYDSHPKHKHKHGSGSGSGSGGDW